MGPIEIGVTLVGEDVVETGLGRTPLQTVSAGNTTCFPIALQAPAAWTSSTFDPPTYIPIAHCLAGLMVLNASGSCIPPLAWYLVAGEVRHDGPISVPSVTAVGTVHHPSGSVLGCEGTTVFDPTLAPGETTVFQLVFRGRDDLRIVGYRVQAGGDPD